MQGTQQQLKRHRDEHLRYAQRDAEALVRARERFRWAYHKMLDCEWYAAFWADTNPERSKGIGDNVPRMQRSMDREASIIKRLEAEVVDSLAIARKAQAALAMHPDQRFYLKVEEPGLWTLVRLCWQGWCNGRRQVRA